MNKVELEILALSQSVAQSQSYAVVLGELYGQRRLPIVIGPAEAQAIAVAMEKMTPSRPLTHDLLRNVMIALDADLKEVVITDLSEGIFFARLVLSYRSGELEIDSRTSDALALAARFGCPIYTFEPILEQAGITLVEETEEEDLATIEMPKSEGSKKSGDLLENLTDEELRKRLAAVLAKEDYEQAARIRDELKKRGLA